jgi:two-component system, LytTR family, sensor kinase
MAAKPVYPIKKLCILNAWLITVCALFVFAFVIVFWGMKGLNDAILGSSLAFVILIPIAFADILWLILFRGQQSFKFSSSKEMYYLAGYLFSAGVFLLTVWCYNYLNQVIIGLIDIVTLLVISLFVNTLIVLSQNYVILQDVKISSDMENSRLKAANAEAANQLLRQQIHPHFLFNALNILKSLYKVDIAAAEEYLVCLSDFLRASVSSNNIKIVRLKDELKLCQDYLRMQKIRFGNALVCEVSVTEEILESCFVPSFSIQPLLENAIKHNELTEEQPLRIFIKQCNDRVEVSNTLQPKITSETSSGSGLANLSERYRILSNDELVIKTDNTTFSVSIKLLDHETYLLFTQKTAFSNKQEYSNY